MARQFLGEKKVRLVEAALGQAVHAAFTRGSRWHFWAQVYLEPDLVEVWVNYRTGEVWRREMPPWYSPWVRRIGRWAQ